MFPKPRVIGFIPVGVLLLGTREKITCTIFFLKYRKIQCFRKIFNYVIFSRVLGDIQSS